MGIICNIKTQYGYLQNAYVRVRNPELNIEKGYIRYEAEIYLSQQDRELYKEENNELMKKIEESYRQGKNNDDIAEMFIDELHQPLNSLPFYIKTLEVIPKTQEELYKFIYNDLKQKKIEFKEDKL